MSEEIETIRTRALQAAQYYHKTVAHNGGGTPPPQHPPPQDDQPFRRTPKNMQRSSMRVNGTVHKDALRAGVTPISENPRLLMKSRGQDYGSNMRLGEYRPPANQSSEHKRSPAATPTGDHRITPQSFQGAMTHTTSSYSNTKSSPRQNRNRTGSLNSENRHTDKTTSAFTPVQRNPKDSRRNEHLRTSNTPGGHSARRHNTSPENRYDILSRARQQAVHSGALTTDNINRHAKKEYFKGDFPIRRSNSNSTLNDTLDRIGSSGHLDGIHRGYGSTSSIDMQSVSGESFFQMLQKFGTDIDQRSPAPPQLEKLLGGGHVTFAEEVITHTAKSSKITMATAELKPAVEVTASPKLSRKGTTKKDKDKEKEKTKVSKTKSLSTEKSIFSKLRGKGEGEIGNLDSDLQNRLEERYRQKAFAHYDCQSINVNLNEVIRNRQHGWKRKNTTTGASAASRGSNSNTPQGSREDLSDDEADFGDGKSNDLVMSCPFFRNEIGGETERKVSLSRVSTEEMRYHGRRGSNEAVLEGPKVRLSGGSPGSPDNLAYLTQPQVERIDYGAHYYRDYFYGHEHQNYLGVDENLGPVAVSIKREKLDEKDVLGGSTNISGKDNNNSIYQYRIIVRTSELTTLRGSILEEAIPSAAKHGASRGLPFRDVLEYVAPELQLSCLRLAVSADKVQEQLMKLDEQGINNKYKVGVMYCKAGQSTEEEMYNNEHAGPAFEEFLSCLGETVRLQGFDKYRAQLDNKSDSTGTHSLYTTYQNNEIMFHVSTMLPYTPNNKQQLLRKRHIGNDIVTIVFQEEGAAPFTPKTIRSHFQHVFILVQAHHPNTDNLQYSVAVSRSKDVPTFGPPLPDPPSFQKSKIFTDFILAKIINAENAVHRSEKFVTMAVRTRQEYLRDLANNFVSNATIDTGAKFGKFILWDKKKEKNPPKVLPENMTKGAIVWKIQVEDSNQGGQIDASLGISAESFVLIEEEEQEPIFSIPSKSVIGWTSKHNSIKLYYNEGECIIMHCADNDIEEVPAIINRLDLVTDGCETNEITLRRNGLGQLGFHVHFQGLVAEVEQYGFAWQAGLRKGSRLVEICKVAVCTLTHDQMIDLLRTSMTVRVVIIPPHEDGTPRRGVPIVELAGSQGNYVHLDTIHRSQGSKLAKFQQMAPFITERDVSPHSRASSSPASVLTGSKLTPPRSDRKQRPPPDYSAAKRDNLPPPYNEVRAVVAKLEQRFNVEEEEKRREERTKSDSSYRGKHRQTSSERPHRTHHDGGQSSVQDSGKMSREIDVQFARESHERQSGRNSKNQRHVQNMQSYANRQGDAQFVNRAAYHDAKQTNAMSRLPLSCSAASAFAEAEKHAPLARHATSMSVSSGDTSLTSTSNSTGASDDKWYDTGDEFHDNSFTHDDIPKETSTDAGYDKISQDTASHDSLSHDTISHNTYDSIQSNYSNTDVPERPPSNRHAGTFASVDNLIQSNQNVAASYLHKTYPPRDRDVEPKQQLPIQSENSAFERPLASLTNLSDTSTHSSSSNRSRQGYHSKVHSLTRSPQIARRKLHAASPEIRDVMKKKTSNRDTDSPLSGRVSSSESLTSRLRPGATPRSAHKQSRSQTSTVKEDLLKLITPDITEMEVKPVTQPRRTGTLSPSLPSYSRVTLQRTLSDESLSGGGTTRRSRRDLSLDVTDNLVFTSTQKSTYPSRMIAETTNITGERNVDKTVVSGNAGGSLFPLPDQGSGLEWSSLVETAKSFEGLDMQSIKSASVGTLDEIADTMPDFDLSSSPEQYNGPSRKIRSGGEEKEAEFSESDLKLQLLHLTRQLSKERSERKALEAEVDQLREDNVRLQDESQTAAAQLRKFTEWFFNTIDRQ